jgi:hypothetical protein
VYDCELCIGLLIDDWENLRESKIYEHAGQYTSLKQTIIVASGK